MRNQSLIAAAALAGTLLWSAAAQAVPGEATGDVNMRTGPGTNYARIATIPAGAPIEVLSCPSWCQVVYAGRQGWVSSNYVAAASGDYAYEPAPRYAYRSAPPAVVYYDYDRYDYDRGPYWRDRYYRDNDFWFDRRWGPRRGFGSGIYFDF